MLTITEVAVDGAATANHRWRQPSLAPTVTGANHRGRQQRLRKPLALVTVGSRR
ncbi:MAG: hypothetical protein ACI360_06140 [Atopobiaceae bacterium]